MVYSDTSAVVLAGGRSSRMGGNDKGLIPFRGRPMVAHVLDTLASRLRPIFINANRNIEQYAAFGYPVISDANLDFDGPLAGFLAAMRAVDTSNVLLMPCDSPLISGELIDRLVQSKKDHRADIAVAHDGDRLQPVYALLSVSLEDDLEAALAAGERKIDRWYPRHRMIEVDCSDIPEVFININTPEELGRLEHPAAARKTGSQP